MTRPRTLSGPLVGPKVCVAIVLRDELKQRYVIDSFIHSQSKFLFTSFLYSVARLSRLSLLYGTTVEFNLLWLAVFFQTCMLVI